MKPINFKRHDGLCPYFEYEGMRFYIEEKRQGRSQDPWGYTLFKKNPFRKVKKSINPQKAVGRFLKGKPYSCSFDIYHYRGLLIGPRQSEGRIIIVPEDDEEIQGPFDSYEGCLKFSKKYLQEYIKKYEAKYKDNQVKFTEVTE